MIKFGRAFCTTVTLGTLTACTEAKISAVDPVPDRVALEIVPPDAGNGTFSLLMQSFDNRGSVIEKVRVDGLRPSDRKSVDVTPEHCIAYNASVKDGAFVRKHLCTGFTIRGTFWGSKGQANFSIDRVAYSFLERLDHSPVSGGMSIELPKLIETSQDGGIMTWMREDIGTSKLDLKISPSR